MTLPKTLAIDPAFAAAPDADRLDLPAVGRALGLPDRPDLGPAFAAGLPDLKMIHLPTADGRTVTFGDLRFFVGMFNRVTAG